ncbi:hypothetical protein Tcan_17617 [Toxocara canis]|uniref:Activin_recp domain-containing protein n=2 Tax=Toxocara canis TaxID=6265 RepID=A0A0B2V963_TOXCA|nr:hypothetical protein Tcan_17617 [Toxocara canis]VDM36865.1 unnamed protein product [Toxocara canis]
MKNVLLQIAVAVLALCLLVDAKSIAKNAINDEQMSASELIDSFLERAKATTHHHHKTHRRHKSMTERAHLVSVDKDGREYVNCVKSVNGSLATVKRCYRPDSEDMRVGCYAVWDVKKQLLVQDCWMQQAISMNNCEERRCAAKKSTFCCCYGHSCNEQFDLSNNSYDNL